MEWWAMSTEHGNSRREALPSVMKRCFASLRLLSACSDTEEMARALADQLNGVIHFDYLDVLAVKENSDEVEWHAWGKGALPSPRWANRRVAHLAPFTTARNRYTVADWDSDESSPLETMGGNSWRPYRLSCSCSPNHATPATGHVGYRQRSGKYVLAPKTVGFLRQVARVAAFAIDDSLNLRRLEVAHAELQRQNERLQCS
jgi:hypothetical protein